MMRLVPHLKILQHQRREIKGHHSVMSWDHVPLAPPGTKALTYSVTCTTTLQFP